MSIEEQVDETLIAYANYIAEAIKLEPTPVENIKLNHNQAKHQIKKLMLDTLKEVLGENEQVVIEKSEYDDWEWCDNCDHWLEDSEFRCLCEVRNQLRQEALTKLEEKLNQLSQQTPNN